MAKTVFNTEVVELQDGTEVRLRPLVIGRLRRFMDEWNKMEAAQDDQNKVFEILVNCTAIALEKELADKVADADDKKEALKEYIEDTLDVETIYKVLEVCGGLKGIGDPKLQEIAEAIANQDQAGTN